MNRNRNRRRGSTLVEVVLAASTTVLVLIGAVGTFVMSTRTWLQGESKIDADSTVNIAIRTISKELREAWSVSVDANGKGLTYLKPAKDSYGNYLMPITADGVTRRIEVSGSDLVITGVGTRKVCKSIILTDPSSPGGTAPYKVFTPGSGSITRSLTIMLVTQRAGVKGNVNTSRIRESIFLRNIPELTK